MPKNVRLSLEAADGLRSAKYPAGTVAGPFRYRLETAAGVEIGSVENDALFAEFANVPDGDYTGYASRLDNGGNVLADSTVAVQFTIVDDSVTIAVPSALSVVLS